MHRRAKRTLALRAPWRTFPGPWPGVVGDMFGGKTPTPAKVRPSAHSPFRRARPLDASRARRRCRREECDAIAALRASRPSSLRFRDLLPVSPPLSQGDVDRAAARKLAQKEAELEMLQVANEALQAQAKMAVEREEATKEVASRHQEALEEARERIDDLEGKLRDATRSGDAPASSASASASSSVPPAGEQGKDAVVELQKALARVTGEKALLEQQRKCPLPPALEPRPGPCRSSCASTTPTARTGSSGTRRGRRRPPQRMRRARQ